MKMDTDELMRLNKKLWNFLPVVLELLFVFSLFVGFLYLRGLIVTTSFSSFLIGPSIVLPFNTHLVVLGFVVPLIVALLMFFRIRKQLFDKHQNPNRFITNMVCVLVVAIILIQVAFQIGVPIQTGSSSITSSLSWPMLVLTFAYLLILLAKKSGRSILVSVGYIMGFLTWASGDLVLWFWHGASFGAYGLLDGDFYAPLALSVTIILAWCIFNRFSKISDRRA